MNEKEATEILGEEFIVSLSVECKHWVHLDSGSYSPEQLQAIAWITQNEGEETPACSGEE